MYLLLSLSYLLVTLHLMLSQRKAKMDYVLLEIYFSESGRCRFARHYLFLMLIRVMDLS